MRRYASVGNFVVQLIQGLLLAMNQETVTLNIHPIPERNLGYMLWNFFQLDGRHETDRLIVMYTNFLL